MKMIIRINSGVVWSSSNLYDNVSLSSFYKTENFSSFLRESFSFGLIFCSSLNLTGFSRSSWGRGTT